MILAASPPNDMNMKRTISFLGLEDLLLGVGFASKRVMRLARDDFVWRLDCKEPKNKSGVAIVLEQRKLLEKAFELGVVAPTDAVADAAGATPGGGVEVGAGGATARWHAFYVMTTRGLVRQREDAEGTRGPRALLHAAQNGHVAKLRRLIRWVMVDVESSDHVRGGRGRGEGGRREGRVPSHDPYG